MLKLTERPIRCVYDGHLCNSKIHASKLLVKGIDKKWPFRVITKHHRVIERNHLKQYVRGNSLSPSQEHVRWGMLGKLRNGRSHTHVWSQLYEDLCLGHSARSLKGFSSAIPFSNNDAPRINRKVPAISTLPRELHTATPWSLRRTPRIYIVQMKMCRSGLGLLRSANQSKCTLILVGNELPSANRRIGSGPSGGVSKLSTRNHLRNANAFNTLDLPEAFAPKNATAFGTRMPLPSCKLPKRPSSSGTPALIVKSITCVSRIE